MSFAAITPFALPRPRFREALEVTVVLTLVTLVCAVLRISYLAVGHAYLLAMIFLSLRVSLWPVLAGAVGATVTWNFVFVPPHFAFSKVNLEDSTLMIAYFTTAVIGAQMAAFRAAAEREKLLEESERLHNTLLDSVAHELKTPVSVLRSAVDQLENQEAGATRPLLLEVQFATHRLDRLVHNLLNQTKIESGILQPRIDWCDVHDIIASARRGVRDRLRGRNVIVTIPDEMPLLFADAPMMEQVVANLLLNAATHTPADSEIAIETGFSVAAREVFISVQDHGPGIPVEFAAVVFEKFQLGRSEHKSGLGLGLSIVRGFMLAQHGTARAESGPAGGARFTVTLPWVATPEIADE